MHEPRIHAATGATVLNVSQSGTARGVGLDYGTAYRWQVRACNANGCSAFSANRYFQTPAAPVVELIRDTTDFLCSATGNC